MYSNNNGSWFEHISRIDHDGRETLSDHVPVVCTFVFKEEIESILRKGSYMKLDHCMLSDPIFWKRFSLHGIIAYRWAWTRGLVGSSAGEQFRP